MNFFKQSPRLKERNLFHAFFISYFKNIFVDYKSPYQIFFRYGKET